MAGVVWCDAVRGTREHAPWKRARPGPSPRLPSAAVVTLTWSRAVFLFAAGFTWVVIVELYRRYR